MADPTVNGVVSQEEVQFQGTPLEGAQEEAGTNASEHADMNTNVPPVGFLSLFRYADYKDFILMFIGTLAAIGNGLAIPLNLLTYGKVLNIFIANDIAKFNQTAFLATTTAATGTAATLMNLTQMDGFVTDIPPVWPQVQSLVVLFAVAGVCVVVAAYMEIAFWTWTAERQTHRIRKLFFDSIIHQDIGWFDTHQSGELNTRLADDIVKLNSGIGDKLATLIQWVTTFFGGYTVGFSQNWELTLVNLAMAPFMFVTVVFIGRTIQRLTLGEQSAYAKAGAIAEQTLANIRTVAAFGGEEKEVERYTSRLAWARVAGVRRGLMVSIGLFLFWTLAFCSFALAFWYGTKLVVEKAVHGGTVLQVFMGVMVGTTSLGHAAPNLEYIAGARGAAATIYSIINQKSKIDSSSEEGLKPEKVEGNLEFADVGFVYPARSEVRVLNNFSLKVDAGQTVALVGASGCGKSTAVQLLQRFYQQQQGQIMLDGHDIRDLNIKWLRSHLGVVSQEPVLFATTIAENIRYGAQGVSQLQIEQAARQANAYDFILKLPDKFDTLVGARGAQLSGGQKQRIAIARALIRNPKILLLDEATSALDTESESIVQDALDKARQGRTTIVIAHRLSTIRNADVIVGLSDGTVCEQGTHEQLMDMNNGIYQQLVNTQTAMAEKKNSELEDDFELEDPLLAHHDLRRGGSARFSARRVPYNQLQSVVSQKSVADGRSRKKSLVETWIKADEEEPGGDGLKLDSALSVRIMRLSSPEWCHIFAGCCAALVASLTFPTFAILFSETIGNFTNIDPERMTRTGRVLAILFATLGVVMGIANALQSYIFSLSGENLTLRLRTMAFKAMLRQDIAWFDDHDNQVGALTARLATDTSAVRGAAGQQLGTIIQSSVTMAASLIIAFVFGWKLAFIMMAFFPLLVFSGMLQGKLYAGYSKEDKSLVEAGGKIAVDAIENIRTVAALNLEATVKEIFNSHFDSMYKKGVIKSHIFGGFYAMSSSTMFFAYAATFSYAAQLVDSDEMVFRNVFRVLAAITFGGQALGRVGSHAPDVNKAKMAAAKLFQLFDQAVTIDATSEQGLKPDDCKGNVAFQNVRFRYPARPDVEVLKELSISVEPGQTLALVGPSGCGKSTTVQLIERFYDSLSGAVTIDGHNVRELNLKWLRSQLGVVSQEPVLFDASIHDNIAYGDNARVVAMDEIITAARDANIHSFIENLPNGYDTNVGAGGTQLSGGQKQRIAIARALIRNPKVLLLDEATSALDTESEQIVQVALDLAQQGRTCITIAHRLSTIQNADVIAVIHNGKVLERGAHCDLMQLEGYYYKLQRAQQRRHTGPCTAT